MKNSWRIRNHSWQMLYSLGERLTLLKCRGILPLISVGPGFHSPFEETSWDNGVALKWFWALVGANGELEIVSAAVHCVYEATSRTDKRKHTLIPQFKVNPHLMRSQEFSPSAVLLPQISKWVWDSWLKHCPNKMKVLLIEEELGQPGNHSYLVAALFTARCWRVL